MDITLTVWEGDYGVASVDSHCLILITYLKITKLPCSIVYGRNPLFQYLPHLSVKEHGICKNIYGFEDIWKFLRSQVLDIDHFMYSEQKSANYAYSKHVLSRLLPGISYTMWVDQQNYLAVTRKWYRNYLFFPINYLYPYFKCNKVSELVKSYAIGNNDERCYKLMADAKFCICELSGKLGKKTYFFGDQPSSIDAYIFGYIAPLMHAPLPSTDLQSFLKKKMNLVRYVNRITSIYFPHQKVQYKYVDKLNREEDMQDFNTSPKTIALAACFVGVAMITYGVINGIIKIPTNDLN